MNIASWVIFGILILLAVLAVKKIIKTKKQGKCIGCANCNGGHCHRDVKPHKETL